MVFTKALLWPMHYYGLLFGRTSRLISLQFCVTHLRLFSLLTELVGSLHLLPDSFRCGVASAVHHFRRRIIGFRGSWASYGLVVLNIEVVGMAQQDCCVGYRCRWSGQEHGFGRNGYLDTQAVRFTSTMDVSERELECACEREHFHEHCHYAS